MEFILIDPATGQREPIPDAVISASDNRDLVARYVAASDAERVLIHAQARDALGLSLAPTAAALAPVASVDPLASLDPLASFASAPPVTGKE